MYDLTLAIPTYNRNKFLRNLLEKLCSQTEIEKVEILISDNCSTDSTGTVVSEFSDRLNIVYLKNHTNLGFDLNYLNCITESSGKYVWVVGDDDEPAEFAVSNILRRIEQKAFDLLILNGGDRNLQGRIIPRIKYKVRDQYNCSEAVFEDIGWHICWIGTFVLRKASVDCHNIRNDEFNQFAHLSLMLRSTASLKAIYYLNDVHVVTTVNNSDYFKSASKLIDVFGRNLVDTLNVHLGRGVTRKGIRNSVQGFNKHLNMFTFTHLLVLRKNNCLNFTVFTSKLFLLQRLNRFSFLFVLSFLAPHRLILQAAAIRKKFWLNNR